MKLGQRPLQFPASPPRLFKRPDQLTAPLYVVTSVFNAPRWRNRWKLYEDFRKRVAEAGAVLYTVEVAFGDREFAVTQSDDPFDLQLRTTHEIWSKENALNLLVNYMTQHLRLTGQPEWKYVATIDADVAFARPDWADETRHQLQHHPVVQMWSHALDLGPDYEPLQMQHGFAHSTVKHGVPPGGYYYYAPGDDIVKFHPGYAWGYRRDAWDGIGGLLDPCVLGSADRHMAYGMYGYVEQTLNPGFHPRYNEVIRQWAARADSAIKRNLGHVKGLVLHYWHGPKSARGYQTRPQILIKNQFNPDRDLYRDAQGLYQLDEMAYGLRDDIREYFRQRDEDSTR